MAFEGLLGFGFIPLFQLNLSLSPLDTLHKVQPNKTTPGVFLPLGVCSSHSKCLLLSAYPSPVHPLRLSSTTFSYESILISWAGRNLSTLCAFGIFCLYISYSTHASYYISVSSLSCFLVSMSSLRRGTMVSVLLTSRTLRSSGFFRY